ncbi:hypothetical protein [Moraxella sp. K127]|uniref:hypothetical protein n=1 Tax=Moraxella sp. K127 TaxID=2780079 RepID=UPI001D104FA4|nr:hypothetical protein [Moraxella sp. K127]
MTSVPKSDKRVSRRALIWAIVPTIITIQSAIWEYIRKDKDGQDLKVTQDRLKINFTTEKTENLETVDVIYNMNDEPVKEGAVLSNFVPILNLMDSNGNQGFSSKRGVVPNKIWNAEKKSWETVNEEYDHDENMINKRIGVIFFQNWYVNAENELKSNTKIYTVYSEKGRQTGGDIAIDKTYEPDDNKHLKELCQEALQVSLSRKEKALAKQKAQFKELEKAKKPLPNVQLGSYDNAKEVDEVTPKAEKYAKPASHD